MIDISKAEVDLYEKYKPTPILRSYPNSSLLLLLAFPKTWIPFHVCDWVYWKYGKADRLHRVCKNCRKKQKKDVEVWITDSVT
jgi:hypothetical protein